MIYQLLQGTKMNASYLAGLLALVCVSAQAGQWRYQDETDKMTGKAASYAQLVSDNTLALGSPYAGKNHGMLTVRQHPKHGLDVLLSVDKGQILCRASAGCAVTVRFGSGKPQRFTVLEPADYSSDTVFIENPARFIAAARKHTQILVQLPMFREGEQLLEFTTPVELVWK